MLEDRVCIAEKLGKWFEKNQNSVQIGPFNDTIKQNFSAEGDKQRGGSIVGYKVNLNQHSDHGMR